MLRDELLHVRATPAARQPLRALATRRCERTRGDASSRRWRATTSDRFDAPAAALRRPVPARPRRRASAAAGRRRAGDHHLRRDARLPAADDRSRSACRAQIQVACAQLPAGTSAAARAASGCRSAATRRASTRSCAPRASATSSSTRTASLTRRRGRARRLRAVYTPARRGGVRRATPRVSQAGLERGEGYPGDSGLPRVLPRHRLRPRLRLHQAVHPGRRAIRKNTGHQVLPHHRQGATRRTSSRTTRRGARERGRAHAGNFMFNREQADRVPAATHRTAGRRIVVAPYDAELYGHWWFEGPHLPRLPDPQGALRPGRAQADHRPSTTSTSTRSSSWRSRPCRRWGDGGYAAVWLDGRNDWIYRHLHKAPSAMVELARLHPDAERRHPARAQPGRARAAPRAVQRLGVHHEDRHRWSTTPCERTREHLLRFSRLYEQIKGNGIDEMWLSSVEGRDNLFPEIDYRVYRPV